MIEAFELANPYSYGFWRTARCPFFCGGHVDDSTTNMHTTDLGGALGLHVIVAQTDGHAPTVALIDLNSPQHEMTPAQARLEAYRLLMAADLAERAALPIATEDIARRLGEALEAAK